MSRFYPTQAPGGEVSLFFKDIKDIAAIWKATRIVGGEPGLSPRGYTESLEIYLRLYFEGRISVNALDDSFGHTSERISSCSMGGSWYFDEGPAPGPGDRAPELVPCNGGLLLKISKGMASALWTIFTAAQHTTPNPLLELRNELNTLDLDRSYRVDTNSIHLVTIRGNRER